MYNNIHVLYAVSIIKSRNIMITKLHKISILSPRLEISIKQSLISQLQCDLPIKIYPTNRNPT